MSPGLMDKLRMMDAHTRNKEAPGEPEAARKPSGEVDAGEETSTSKEGVLPFYHIRDSFPLSMFCDRRFANSQCLPSLFGVEIPSKVNPEDFLFLDTETTGLSGGAGTIAFQIGLGYFEGNRFVVEQFLMRDYHEEAAMLREVAARLARFSLLVTFNGRTFDVPLLKSRLLVNRQRQDVFVAEHLDLLYPARRMWKLRLKNCRLSNLEEALLGIQREDDLPGALVPQTYFQFLKDGNFAPIQGVLLHNQQDIVSLAQLFFFLCKEYMNPEGVIHGQDLLSQARHHEKSGNTAQAAKCYRLCAKGETRPQAFQALAAAEKRQGRSERAIRLYTAMLKRGDEPALACEALAKLYEHQQKDIPSAMHYTRQALIYLSEPTLGANPSVQEGKVALQYRYARLQRKQKQ